MVFDQLAEQDFDRAVFRAFWRKIVARLTGTNNQLLPFDEIRQQLPVRGQHSIGVRQVEVDKIIGSLGRYHDFDRAFLPTQARTRERWLSIDKAHYEEVVLPPVELYKIGEVYFVKDGNHRVSVARERGQVYIDANVIEIDTPVELTPDITIDKVTMKAEQAAFMESTHLLELRPDAIIETTLPGMYKRLQEQISLHRWYVGERRGAEVSPEEAVTAWYDDIYLPVVQVIREQGLLKSFPGSSETDLYLWISEYQGYLREAYKVGGRSVQIGDSTQAREEAARQLKVNYPLPAVKKLVNVLNRTDWLGKLILEQDRAAFFEKTHLDALRPQVQLETTIPGQYNILLGHIDVHRWYLGEKRKTEVPYTEAAVSWCDNVYMPLVEVIDEQGILEQFPGRTVTDLYLWVVERREYLQAMFGSELTIPEVINEKTDDFVEKRKLDTNKQT